METKLNQLYEQIAEDIDEDVSEDEYASAQSGLHDAEPAAEAKGRGSPPENADVQTTTEANEVQARAKSVAAVKTLFEKEGYSVDLRVSDKGTAIETWNMGCILLSPANTLVAIFCYDADNASLIGENLIPAAEASKQLLKVDGCWIYYGTPDAIALFESFGTGEPAVLFAPEKQIIDPKIAVVEETFKNAGYMVTVTPYPDGTQLTCILPSPHNMLIAGNGGAEWTNMISGALKASAESLNLEMKRNGNWFYYGSSDAVRMIEELILK